MIAPTSEISALVVERIVSPEATAVYEEMGMAVTRA